MKILVVCQHYWPEPFPLTDICESLVKRGHKICVVTDVPNYPMGYIYPEYRSRRNRLQEHNGVRIIRTFTIGRRNNVLFRLLNYISYAISSTHFIKGLDEEFDVVFANQTSPVTMVMAALEYAKKHKKKCIFYCMDLWPASLAAGGIKRSSALYKLFHRISGNLYRRADRILITSRMFRSYLRDEFDIADETISYLPQFAPFSFTTSNQTNEQNKEVVDVMFAGNIGVAQSITTILRAADILRGNKTIRWHIVGDGSELENLRVMAGQLNLENVIFHGRKHPDDMPGLYSMADALLVTLTADPFISLTLPAKVQSYMATGKPIIAAASGEIAKVIAESGCGFCVAAEDAQGLADAVVHFLDHKDKAQLGRNAYAYYKTHFTQELFMEKLEEELRNNCM